MAEAWFGVCMAFLYFLVGLEVFDPALMVLWGSCMSFVLNREGWRSGSLYNWWRLQVFHSICGRQG